MHIHVSIFWMNLMHPQVFGPYLELFYPVCGTQLRGHIFLKKKQIFENVKNMQFH